jgi:uncharacterized SAM-binding protein YcdF (DUF218 family)
MSDRVFELAKIVWDYHRLGHSLVKSDCILVLCSHDPRVAVYSAELFLAGWAPLLVYSGNVGELTAGMYGQPEAEFFAEIAIHLGVPADKILIENRATNTGENILFVRSLLQEQHHDLTDFILVQKPFMERRAFATFQKVWPEKEAIVTSPPIEFIDYPTADFPRGKIIEIMVGDLDRIIRYPALGFQTVQGIPDEVLAAFEELIDLGYDGHLAA